MNCFGEADFWSLNVTYQFYKWMARIQRIILLLTSPVQKLIFMLHYRWLLQFPFISKSDVPLSTGTCCSREASIKLPWVYGTDCMVLCLWLHVYLEVNLIGFSRTCFQVNLFWTRLECKCYWHENTIFQNDETAGQTIPLLLPRAYL